MQKVSSERTQKINVLSLFDGISCGQLALQKAGIEYNQYFASEIDKYPIAVTQKRFPETIQLGNIENWHKWKLPKIDLIIGGSPCQGFSSAGNQLNFDDPRSKLFFEFVNVINHYKPQYFLLENVKMKKEWSDIITKYMKVKPILINSALVSAQRRKRLYWTNIPNVMQPKDKKILLQDIIEHGYTEKNKSYCLVSSYTPSLKRYLKKHMHQIVWNNWNAHKSKLRIIANSRCIDEKSPSCTTRMNNPNNNGTTVLFYKNLTWRKLTPLECERLQTIPDNYTLVAHPHFHGKMMSDSRRYMMIGNAWTVDVIAHIFSFMNYNKGD
jgi:DNA (cytosine-5)-methyltransferase 3A